jgi:uncharacterized membrane protein YfcA
VTALLAEAAAQLADPRFWIAAIVTAIAGVMRGYSGFGTAVLLAPAYSVLWGPRIGVPIVLLLELFVSVQLVPRAFHQADRRVVLPIGGAAVLAMPFGAWVLLTADQEALRRFIGGFVLAFALILAAGWRYHGTRPLGLNLAVGTVAGLLKGATGVSGPPVILYLLAGPEEARRHRANLILFFALISVVSIVPPALGGLMVRTPLLIAALLLPVMLAAVPIGARLFLVVPERMYRRLALALLLAAGTITLLA